MEEEYGYEGIEEQFFSDSVADIDNSFDDPSNDFYEPPVTADAELDEDALEPDTPDIDKPDNTEDLKEKKVKGVDKTGEHEGLWDKIKNGFKKIKEFFHQASEAIRTRDISMFKAWVYGGHRLVNTLVETDITNNAIKQKEALAINKSLVAQVKELEAKLEEIQKQQNEGPDISDKPASIPTEQTTEWHKTQITTDSMRELIDGQKEKIRDYAGALETAKAEETPDKEKVTKLSEGLLAEYERLSTVYADIKNSLSSDKYEFSSSPEKTSQFVESLQTDIEEVSTIVTEAFKTEIKEEELSEPDETELIEDDRPGLKEKIKTLDEQAYEAADILTAELGRNNKDDPSLTIDKNELFFDNGI